MERHHFQQELSALKERLLAMGGLAEERVKESVRGVKERDHAALDAVLSGEKPPAQQKPSIGCNIKWKRSNEPDYWSR